MFPTVHPDTPPTVRRGGREPGLDDTFAGIEEDRYPNIFRLRDPEADSARDALFQALNRLPRWTVTLTHDVGSNITALGQIWR